MPTLAEAILAFLENVRFPRPNTERTYRQAVKAFTRCLAARQLESQAGHPIPGSAEYEAALERAQAAALSIPVQEVERSVLAEFTGWMGRTPPQGNQPTSLRGTREGYSLATQKLYLSALRAVFRYWRANYPGWLSFSEDEEQRAFEAASIGRERKPPARHSRLPANFGQRMVETVLNTPLTGLPALRRLDLLRERTLIVALWATALRIGDLLELTRADLEDARSQGGRLEVRMRKVTSVKAHIRLSEEVLALFDEYLAARDDRSPYLLIQHFRGPGKRKQWRAADFEKARKGYGAQLSAVSAWRIVQSVARRAGFDETNFTSPHAFRHWHALSLIDIGVALENVQSVLGHASPVTTRTIYAPEPNQRAIDAAEQELQVLPARRVRAAGAPRRGRSNPKPAREASDHEEEI